MTDTDYINIKEKELYGRYITLDMVQKLILKTNNKIIGYSFNNKPLYKIEIGNGDIKILIWSQMHGNESTGTKAIFDLINFLTNPNSFDDIKNYILSKVKLVIIPILNPDGAQLYTRKNAQGVDLNRDAVELKTPESKILNKILNQFKPSYCFNLHDQRPIFSVGEQNLPATISFLAPSEDEERSITKGRKETMSVIVAMNNALQTFIPNQVGRYTDEFYPTATGDNFQKAGFNTILIEAGHFPNDYNREITRRYNFIALLEGIKFISKIEKVNNYAFKDYFNIPNNEKKYFEILYNNVIIGSKKYQIGVYLKDEYKDNGIVYNKDFIILKENTNYNANKVISKKLIFNKEKDINAFISKLT